MFQPLLDIRKDSARNVRCASARLLSRAAGHRARRGSGPPSQSGSRENHVKREQADLLTEGRGKCTHTCGPPLLCLRALAPSSDDGGRQRAHSPVLRPPALRTRCVPTPHEEVPQRRAPSVERPRPRHSCQLQEPVQRQCHGRCGYLQQVRPDRATGTRAAPTRAAYLLHSQQLRVSSEESSVHARPTSLRERRGQRRDVSRPRPRPCNHDSWRLCEPHLSHLLF